MNYALWEEELFNAVQQMKNGNQEAYNTVYNLSGGYTYKLVHNLTQDDEATTVIIGQVYQDIWANIYALDNPESFYSWAGQIATTDTVNYLRNTGSLMIDDEATELMHAEDEEYVAEYFADDRETFIPGSILEDTERQRLLRDYIENLSLADKIIVQYYYYEGMPVYYIAQMLGYDSYAVSKSIRKIKKKLRNILTPDGEEKGARLYDMTAIPILWLLFKSAVTNIPVAALCDGAVVTAGVAGSDAVASGAGAASGAGTVASGAGTVASGAGVATVGAGLGIKVAVAVVTTALVGTGVAAFTKWELDKSDKNSVSTEITAEATTDDVNDDTDSITEATEKVTTEATTEQVIEFTEPENVEYMILAQKYADWDENNYDGLPEGPDSPFEVVSGFEIYDIDGDEKNELIMEVTQTNTGIDRPTQYTLDAEDGTYSIWSDQSASGSTDFYIDDENKCAYLEKDYATVYLHIIAFNNWTASGWSADTVLEKVGEELEACTWDGEEVSESEWNEKRDNLSTRARDIANNLQESCVIESDSTAENVDTVMCDYWKNKGVDVYNLEVGDGSYYIVLDNFFNKMWSTQVNEDCAAGDEALSSAESLIDGDVVVVVEPDGKGSRISCQLFYVDYDFKSVTYDDGIIVTDDENSYMYRTSDSEYLEYVKKLNLDEVEKSLLVTNWYSVGTTHDGSIYECEFFENAKVICRVYDGSGDSSPEETEASYEYSPSDKILCIDFGQYSAIYTYYEDLKAFISDYGENCTDDGEVYESCMVMVPESDFPEYTDLFNTCDSILKSYYGLDNQDTISSNTGSSSDELTEDQAVTAVMNYCYEKDPTLYNMSQDDHFYYWALTDSQGSEYTVTYRSYTGALIYFHVNKTTGEVTSTEYVPGIIDEESPGSDYFNAWDYL
jgi:RNA polymerase sigma factor (sigma-70 family)